MSELHTRLAAAGANAIVGHGTPIEWGKGIADEILPIVEELLAAERKKAQAPFLRVAAELDREADERERRADVTPDGPVYVTDRIKLFTGARHQHIAARHIRRAAEADQ